MTAKFLSGSVVQGSNDAFATAAIATGIAAVNLGLRVRGFEFSLPFAVETDSNIEMEVTRRLPTAMLGLADRRSMFYQKRHLIITTSGLAIYDQVTRYAVPKDLELLIVEDPIYLSIDTNGSSTTNTLVARIYYEEVRLTDVQKLSALQESANA